MIRDILVQVIAGLITTVLLFTVKFTWKKYVEANIYCQTRALAIVTLLLDIIAIYIAASSKSLNRIVVFSIYATIITGLLVYMIFSLTTALKCAQQTIEKISNSYCNYITNDSDINLHN